MRKNTFALIICLAVFILFWQKAYSNGGPLNSVNTQLLGRHNFKNVLTVKLIKEELNITILGEYVRYDVNYEFVNNGADLKVDYAFPVEFSNEWSQDQKNPDTKNIITSFNIFNNGKNIPYSTSFEKLTSGGREDEYPLWNKWFRTKLVFNENEKKKLKIEYIVKANNDDAIYTKSFMPEYSPRTTNYNFQGAKYWGDGVVGKVEINIYTKELEESGGKIISIEPGGYTINAHAYTREYKNVSISAIPDLVITYDDEKAVFSEYIRDSLITRDNIEYIKASSTLKDKASGDKRYCAENMIDGLHDTAWAAWWEMSQQNRGYNEKNDTEFNVYNQSEDKTITIEIKLKRDYHVLGVGILNGYLKSEKIFKENARIKTIFVGKPEPYTGYNYNSADVAKIDDKYYIFKYETGELQPKFYSDFNAKNIIPFIDWIADYGEGYGSAKIIRLDIQTVIPGSKYAQVAISELFIAGWPAREDENKAGPDSND